MALGTFGMAFGPLGLLGVYDNKLWCLQYVKLAALALVFTADLVVLRKCEVWAGSLEAQRHPNPLMYDASVKGLCATTRNYFVLGFLVDFGINLHFALVTADLCKKLAAGPGYSIRFFGASGLAPANSA